MSKIELKANSLQSPQLEQQNQGFTLFELLVVMLIIGILAAIGIPSFIKQTVKAKQSAARESIARVNHAQVVYRMENDSFATNYSTLLVGTLDNNSSVDTYKGYTFQMSSSADTTSIIATPVDPSLKAYSGGTNRYVDSNYREFVVSILCEANTPGTATALPPTLHNNADPDCPNNYKNLNGNF
ncbi:MAG TPA: type IV pilin-like G/H family protein [Oculatellaceae cyanobacterium]|jgi:type IV pilus assembly protein PilA